MPDSPHALTLDLFGHETSGEAGQGKALRSLSNLMADIAECRTEIARREAVLEDLRGRMARELAPLERRLVDRQVEIFRLLCGKLRAGWLNKRDKRKLREILRAMADGLEEAFGLDLEAERRAFLGGKPHGDGEDDPFSDLADALFGAWKDDPQAEAPGEGRGPRPGGSAGAGSRKRKKRVPSQAEARKEAQEQVLAGDIRALYLMLARALHPDKESDPLRREEKTAWMQKVTAAYGRRNLAELLDILGRNPLDAVGPYLSRAPLAMVRGFAKRLRRELDALRGQLWRMDRFVPEPASEFLRDWKVHEPAWKRHLARVRKALKESSRQMAACQTQEGVETLIHSLRNGREPPF